MRKTLWKKLGALAVTAVTAVSLAGCSGGAMSEIGSQTTAADSAAESSQAEPQAAEAESDSTTAAVTTSAGETIKVGILHSLSGTMAISETSVRDA